MSKNVIITGTSRGIGFEMAKIFANKGYNVLALSRDSSKITAINNNNISTLNFDITLDSDHLNLNKLLSSTMNEIHILINNAGLLVNKKFDETSSDDFLNIYNTNVFGVVKLIQTCLPYMKKNGQVINISSIGGVQGSMKFAGLSAYSSSKGALITLTECLAEEFQAKKIKFNCLALGAVQTEMLNEAFPGYEAPLSANDISSFIVDFCLNGSKYFNGKFLPVALTTP